MDYSERMFWLGENPRLWAMLHQPLGSDGAKLECRRAVVFCPPFAEEEKLSRRLYAELARALASRGVTAVRFSYGGTGDSQGEFSDFTVESALSDVERALSYCRDTLQCSRLSTFGLRLGGTFALQAASNGPLVDRVALWSPIQNGRSYVRMNFRRKAIRQMMNTDVQDASEQPAAVIAADEAKERTTTAAVASPGDPASEIFDFDGYPVAQKLWTELEALQGAPPPGWKGSALVVSVGPVDRPSADCSSLTEKLVRQGADADLRCVVAQPFWNLLGLVECPEIIELTADWLAA